MKCDKCNTDDANQVIKCEECGEAFVATELCDYDQTLIEAALAYFPFLPNKLTSNEEVNLWSAIRNHPNCKEEWKWPKKA